MVVIREARVGRGVIVVVFLGFLVVVVVVVVVVVGVVGVARGWAVVAATVFVVSTLVCDVVGGVVGVIVPIVVKVVFLPEVVCDVLFGIWEWLMFEKRWWWREVEPIRYAHVGLWGITIF